MISDKFVLIIFHFTDESVEIHLDYYRLQINRISNRVLAKTNVLLDHVSCLSSECNLGNLIADSMIAYVSVVLNCIRNHPL